MFYLIGGLIIFLIIVKMIQKKMIIRLDTIFRKGFRKRDDKYGIYVFER